ncbi:MAG: hypothetical protein FJ026_05555 [Chloroflexi bacterium]|nr:hypothetical protein [Chloroflexota bacterium]
MPTATEGTAEPSAHTRWLAGLASMRQVGYNCSKKLNRAPVELRYHIIASGLRLYEQDMATRAESEW